MIIRTFNRRCFFTVRRNLLSSADKVSGTVTRGGQPVPRVTVFFAPAGGRPSWGVSNADGRYELEYTREQPGAVLGKHKVYVKFRGNAGPGATMALAENPPQPHPQQAAIAAKFGDENAPALEFDVREAGQVIDIALD